MDDSLLEADLDAYLDDEAGLPAEDEQLDAPSNVEQADLLLRRRAGVAAEIGRIELLVEQRVAKIKAWGGDRTAGLRRRLAQIDAALEAWSRAVLSDRKTKTERLPYGSVSLRGHQTVLRVLDDDAFVKWCADNARSDTFIKTETTRTPMIAEIKRLTAQGQPLDDIEIDGVTFARWQAIDPTSGEVIPNVEYRKEKLDTFSLKP